MILKLPFTSASNIAVTLDTQIPITVKPYMESVIGSLRSMTARAGHHLPGPRIINIFPDRMGKGAMQPVTFVAHVVDRSLDHVRMIGTVRCMAVATGSRHFMLEGSRIVSFKCIGMTGAANITLLAFQQALVIACMRRVTCDAAVILVPDQMIVR